MNPHHCRHCGLLLRTWHERESHIDLRASNDGDCASRPTPTQAPEEAARRRRLDESFDMKKMRERLHQLSLGVSAPTNLRAVERMTVVGRRGRSINVVRELYLLSLDSAKERGVCPDPSNDNGAEQSRSPMHRAGDCAQPGTSGADN